MENQLLQVKRNLSNSNLNNKYIYIDEKTRFVYKTSSLNQVVGVNNILRNKIVKIIEEYETDNKRFALLKAGNEKIGWTEISDDILIRLYRLPKVNGKLSVKNNEEYTFNNINYEKEILQLKEKIIKARYMFYYEGSKYLIVSKVDKKNITPVKLDMFKKLIFPQNELKIYLPENTSLYYSSNFNNKINELKKSGEYTVISYINESTEARIEINNERYWLNSSEMLPFRQEFSHDLDTLEVIDFITYLSESNKYHMNRVKILNNQLAKVRRSITFNNESEEIYFNNQLGDINVD